MVECRSRFAKESVGLAKEGIEFPKEGVAMRRFMYELGVRQWVGGDQVCRLGFWIVNRRRLCSFECRK